MERILLGSGARGEWGSPHPPAWGLGAAVPLVQAVGVHAVLVARVRGLMWCCRLAPW